MHELITALVATLTILLAGSIVGKAEATPRPVFPLTKSYAPTEKVGYYRRCARRQFRRGYRRGNYAMAMATHTMAMATDAHIMAMPTHTMAMATGAHIMAMATTPILWWLWLPTLLALLEP